MELLTGEPRAKTTESFKPELAAVWGLRLLARALWEELGFPLAFWVELL